MNSKCKKSNLAVQRYILLFAYLPAPEASAFQKQLNSRRHTYISFLHPKSVYHFFPSHLSFVSCPSPPILSLPIVPSLLTHPVPPLSLTQTPPPLFPPCRRLDREAAGTQMTIFFPSLCLRPPLSCCWRPSPATAHPPTSSSDQIDIQICPVSICR